MTDEWKSVREHIVVDYPEYELALEEFRKGPHQMVFVHLWVKKDWSVKLLKHIKHTWAALREHVTCPIFATADVDDDKWIKFVTMFGFKFLLYAQLKDGSRRRIYWHQGIGNGQHFNTKAEFDKHVEHDDNAVTVPTAVS